MSFFDSFLGGAAGAGANIINQQMQDEQKLKAQEQLARLNEELMTQREKTIMEMRRAANLQAGQEINAEATKIGGSRNSQALTDAQNDPEINGVQSVDSKETLQKAGIINTRAQGLDDRATAAENLGYLDHAKEIRGQQQIENTRASEERRLTIADNQANNAARLADIKERDLARKEKDDKSDREMAEKRLLALVNKQSGANREEKVLSIVDSQRKDLTQQRNAAESEMKREFDEAAKDYREELKTVFDDKAKAALKSDLEKKRAEITSSWKPKIDELAGKSQSLDADYAYVRQKAGFPTKKTEPSAKVLTFDPKTGKFK